MAQVRIEGDALVVELSGWDKFLAVHGSLRIPLANVAGASTTKPPSFWETLKVLGTNAGALKMAGTFVYHGETVFFDYQGHEKVLVIDLAPGASNYKHVFVHVDPPDTPEDAAARVSAARAGSPSA